MAIIDSTQVFFNGAIKEESKVVPLTGMKIPGKMNPIPMRLTVKKAISGPTTSLDIKLQQSNDGKTAWEDVPDFIISIPSKDYAKLGRVLAVKYLPRTVTKPFVKAVLTANGGGTLAGGELFFGLLREDYEPFEPGMYINKGQVQG